MIVIAGFGISKADSLTLNVNMSYWTATGVFNPTTDFVDVAGSFNGWNGANCHLTTIDNIIYTFTFDTLQAGTSYDFKFRINGSWLDATCEFPSGGPNRSYTMLAGANVYNAWYNNDSTSPVTFEVNMWYYALIGTFNPLTDFVDVAGTMNGWSGSLHLSSTNDSIYSITYDSLPFGSVQQFKFRINGSWNDATCEFPSGGANRTYTVPAGPSTYYGWYNNMVVGIQQPALVGNVQVYPNPVSDMMNVISSKEITTVVISNTLGQEVARYENLSNDNASFNVSDLKNGMYVITVSGNSGVQLIQKFFKN